LVEHHDAVVARIEEAPVVRSRAGPGPAVQKHHRAALGVARDLPVHRMAPVQVEPPVTERLDGRKQVLCEHRTGWIHGLLRAPLFALGAPPSYRSGPTAANSSWAVVAAGLRC